MDNVLVLKLCCAGWAVRGEVMSLTEFIPLAEKEGMIEWIDGLCR